MKKTFYTTRDIKNFIITQNIVPHNFARRSYQSGQYQAIIDQSRNFIQDIINNKAEINAQDIHLVEDLIYSLSRVLPRSQQPQIKQYLHRIAELHHSARQQKQQQQTLRSLAVVEAMLNNKKQARNLSPEDFIIIQQTLQAAPTDKKTLRLKQQLQSYAQLKYTELKGTQSFNELNPLHQDFKHRFNLHHIQIKPTSAVRTPINNSTSASRAAPSAPKIGLFSQIKTSFRKLGENIAQFGRRTTDFLETAYRKSKNWVFVGVMAAASVMLGKGIYKEATYQYIPPSHPKTENTKAAQASIADTTKTKDFQQALAEQKDSVKTAAQSKQKTPAVKSVQTTASKVSTATTPNQTQLSGDYYDTSLEIHLKSKAKVAALYHKIDSLAAKGLIKFSQGTNTKWYAHAATMYQLIRPNSQENKDFQSLLNGQSVDTAYINNLVIKAGTKGQGVKPDNNSITTSNFDHAPSALQMQHLHNLQAQR